MSENNVLIIVNPGLEFAAFLVEVLQREIANQSARICASQHQADFLDSAMNHVGALLNELVCEDGHRLDVAVTHELLRGLTAGSIVECAIGINTVVPVFQQRMTENLCRVIMLMLPNQRYNFAIAFFESVSADGTSVCALQIIFGSVTTKIELSGHNQLPPLYRRSLPLHNHGVKL